MITLVYAYNDGKYRLNLWDYLESANPGMPWCIVVDFNCVLGMIDISGGREH